MIDYGFKKLPKSTLNTLYVSRLGPTNPPLERETPCEVLRVNASNIINKRLIVGLGWWSGIQMVHPSSNPFHVRGSNRNPNHRAPNQHLIPNHQSPNHQFTFSWVQKVQNNNWKIQPASQTHRMKLERSSFYSRFQKCLIRKSTGRTGGQKFYRMEHPKKTAWKFQPAKEHPSR